MGRLTRHPIKQWQEDGQLQFFVETGLWRGAGLRAAMALPFYRCYSIDVNAEYIAAMADNLGPGKQAQWRVQLLLGDSQKMVHELVSGPELARGPALWWLDAHYPERYQADGATTPLLAEVRSIVAAERDHAGDVLVIDDTRIYGQPCQNGPLPEVVQPGDPQDLAEVRRLLQHTHYLRADSRDEGYLIALPKDP